MFESIRYGGDYNPEQWPVEIWEEDYEAFAGARINTVTLGVFAWSYLQPSEDVYDFALLDQIVDRAVRGGSDIVLATATGAMPPWLAHEYPEVTRTDFEGRVHRYGQRHNHCPNSPVFRRLSAALAERIAERYAGTPGLIAWHVGNEYGGPDGSCYCDNCARAFRSWLRNRYGSLERLNAAWNTMFWSHLFTDWDQIQPPSALTEHWPGPNNTAFQGMSVDYRRFMSDSLLQNFVDEKERIRRHDADTPVTTNFMGAFRPIDYHRWAEHLDLVTWDNYPPGRSQQVRMAFAHDLMRGIKGGEPIWIMEQTPTITASRGVNPVKRPGVLALWSWQAVAHGADAVLYFQMRASRGACEKYHGAVLNHAGRTDTRPFREVAALGADMQRAGEAVIGGRSRARVALIFDWDNWWTTEMTDGYNRHVSYLSVVLQYYRALWNAQAIVDVVPMGADLGAYDVVIAPMLHMLKGDVAARLSAFVEAGGSALTTFWSGAVDESTNAYLMDLPGPLGELFGIRIDEIDSAEPGVVNPVTFTGALATEPGWTCEAGLVMELLVPRGAQAAGTYGSDFYAGTPAVTVNRYGEGDAWYVGAGLDDEGIGHIVAQVVDRHDLRGPYAHLEDVEYTERHRQGRHVAFLLNHSSATVRPTLHASGRDLVQDQRLDRGEEIELPPTGVLVWQLDEVD